MMRDSDHGSGDVGGGGGEVPVVIPADNACVSHTHVEITDSVTGLKTLFDRSYEQGNDGELRPVIKKKIVQTAEEPYRSA
jgi:hypothetical protein